MNSNTARRDLVQETSDISLFDLWTPDSNLMMEQIQGIVGLTLGDHDLEA